MSELEGVGRGWSNTTALVGVGNKYVKSCELIGGEIAMIEARRKSKITKRF